MAFKNWIIPTREDILDPDKRKNFVVSPEGEFAITTARKVLQKFGFNSIIVRIVPNLILYPFFNPFILAIS